MRSATLSRLFAMACLGSLATCGTSTDDGNLLLNLSGLPGRATTLTLTATLDGRAAMKPQQVAAPVNGPLGVVLPGGTTGQLVLTLQATDSDGCLQAAGKLEATLTGKYTELPVNLTAQSPRLCGSLAGCAAGTLCPYTSSVVNTNLSALWSSSPSNIWAVGDSGVTLRYDGKTWQSVPTPTTLDNLKGVWGSSATDVWAVGTSGRILHYDGQSWTNSTNGAVYDLMGVYGLGLANVWAVGSSSSAATVGEFWRWDGMTWRKVPTGIAGSLFSVWASSPTDIFAGGVGGLLIHYDGANSASIASGTTSDLHSIWGASSSLIFAGGFGGVVIKNSGSGWKPVTVTNYAATLYGIVGDGTTVYGVGNAGSNGDLIKSASPFDTFAVQTPGNSTSLTSIIIGSNGIAWVAGKVGYLGYFDTRP